MWQATLIAALAGGMAWGIRGQYGHETGAMIAGLLVSLVLTLLLCPSSRLLGVARAVALCTIAMGFGGSMTYGQTIGLTQNQLLVGNYDALAWGMFGLSIKGALWITFAGAFLGIGLSGVRYRSFEMLILMLALIGLFFLGVRVFNEPFSPESKRLPMLYFSEAWVWNPEGVLKPRKEVWGGMLVSWLGLMAYSTLVKKDALTPRLALWGLAGGAIGFPAGQSLQSFHAWNPGIFQLGFMKELDPFLNWWNLMETTFGAIMGGILGLGLWLNRERISVDANSDVRDMPWLLEFTLIGVHVGLLVCSEFLQVPVVSALYDYGLALGLIPIVCVVQGKWSPFLMTLPIPLIPIAGKTLREVAIKQGAISLELGWIVYVVIPLLLTTAIAVVFALRENRSVEARGYLRCGLIASAWLYFGLNFAFFRFPFVWCEWTSRTPHALIFAVCLLGITILVWKSGSNASMQQGTASKLG